MSNRPVALITGATSGIGLAFAQAYAQRGYDLFLTGRRQEILAKNAQYFEQHHHIFCRYRTCELSNEAQIEALAAEIANDTIDVLINNAGFGLTGAFPGQSAEDTLAMLRLHTLCTMRLTQAVLPQMLARNSGTIINVASDAAYVIVPGNALYSGTKAFIKQFTEGLYLDLLGLGSDVQVQALCPGLTKTDFQLKMGLSPENQTNHGVMRWQDAHTVVAHSLKALRQNRPVCICGGAMGVIENLLTRLLPKRLYYPLISKLFPLKIPA